MCGRPSRATWCGWAAPTFFTLSTLQRARSNSRRRFRQRPHLALLSCSPASAWRTAVRSCQFSIILQAHQHRQQLSACTGKGVKPACGSCACIGAPVKRKVPCKINMMLCHLSTGLKKKSSPCYTPALNTALNTLSESQLQTLLSFWAPFGGLRPSQSACLVVRMQRGGGVRRRIAPRPAFPSVTPDGAQRTRPRHAAADPPLDIAAVLLATAGLPSWLSVGGRLGCFCAAKPSALRAAPRAARR